MLLACLGACLGVNSDACKLLGHPQLSCTPASGHHMPGAIHPLLQVKKRCRWLLSFTQQALALVRGGAADPFAGAEVDANALGWALAVVTSRAFRTRGPNQVCARLKLQECLPVPCHALLLARHSANSLCALLPRTPLHDCIYAPLPASANQTNANQPPSPTFPTPCVQPAAMLPLIDMANHSFQPNARISPGPSGSMCMVAIRWVLRRSLECARQRSCNAAVCAS